jgi:PIN domain nuclease of toxin-antitoxin system
MAIYIADTHALLWYLADSPRLSAAAKKAFDEAKTGRVTVVVPAIVLAELIWTILKGRINVDLKRVLATVQKHYTITPLEPADVLKLPDLSPIPEMHDRMIVAEALRRGASLITRDEVIIKSGLVPVIW